MMHGKFKPWTKQKERQTHTFTHRERERERERKGEQDQQGYSSSSSNGETLVADAKAGDASRCHRLMTARNPVHATGSMTVAVLKLRPG